MKTTIALDEPALVLIFRSGREPVLMAPDDKQERDRIVAWLESEYPDWAAAIAAAAAASLKPDAD